MDKNKNNNERPLSYPLPTEADQQLNNQPEYVDQQPNDFGDKSISDMPANDNRDKESNDPRSEEKDS